MSEFKLTSQIGLGCMGMAAFYGKPSPQETVQAVVDAAFANNCTHFDTAEIYRSGNVAQPDEHTVYNECQLAKALKGKDRASFQLATKFYPGLHANCDLTSVEAALDASLLRLEMDYVDLYYMHRCVSLERTKEFVTSAAALVKSGKIRAIGLSECPASWLDEACKIAPIACIQMEWSALSRTLEDKVVPMAVKHNVVVVAYSPLSRNLLAEPKELADDDWRKTQPRFNQENHEENKKIVAQLKKAAEALGASPAQLSLAWLYTKARQLDVKVLPIPGTTKVKNLESNCGALHFVPLDDETMTMIDSLEAKGSRYQKEFMSSVHDALEEPQAGEK